MGKKKAGQHATTCKAYKAGKRREKNKVLKLRRHLKRFGDDAAAQASLEKYQKIA
jgi:hypothetical protein